MAKLVVAFVASLLLVALIAVSMGLRAIALAFSLRTAVVVGLALGALAASWVRRKGRAAFGCGEPFRQPASLLIADREREGAVRVVVLSDTHNKHDKFEVPDGDILLHCGDFTFHGTQREIRAFNEWLGTLPHRHKFVIAGNHELTLDGAFYEANWSRFHKERDTERPGSDLARQLITNAVYLEHETVSACGLRIYGCPTMPHLPRRMAFGVVRGSDEERAAYAQIPADLDILMTHAPPAGIRDTVILGFGVGSQLLRDAVRRSRPRFHVFGHIHESFGIDDASEPGTTFINAACMTLIYQPLNSPIVFDLVPRPRQHHAM